MPKIPTNDILAALNLISYDVDRMDEACDYLSHRHPDISEEDVLADVMNVLYNFCKTDKTPTQKERTYTYKRSNHLPTYGSQPQFELSPRDFMETSSPEPSSWNQKNVSPNLKLPSRDFCKKKPFAQSPTRNRQCTTPQFELSPRDFVEIPSPSPEPSPWNRFSDSPLRNRITAAIIDASLQRPRRLSFSDCISPLKKKLPPTHGNPLLGYRSQRSLRNSRTHALIPPGLLISDHLADSSDSD